MENPILCLFLILNNGVCLEILISFGINRLTSKIQKYTWIYINIEIIYKNININFGLILNEQNYGVYISVSLYPDKVGMLKKHSDSHNSDSNTILHFMLPLTFKGVDYDSGDLYIIDKHGIEIDVDTLTCKGDLIFFEWYCKHGVNIIQSSNSIGRLAVFAIAYFFQKDANYLVLKRSIKIFLIELLYKIHLIKLLKKYLSQANIKSLFKITSAWLKIE